MNVYAVRPTDAAKSIGVSLTTVYNWARNGKLPMRFNRATGRSLVCSDDVHRLALTYEHKRCTVRPTPMKAFAASDWPTLNEQHEVMAMFGADRLSVGLQVLRDRPGYSSAVMQANDCLPTEQRDAEMAWREAQRQNIATGVSAKPSITPEDHQRKARRIWLEENALMRRHPDLIEFVLEERRRYGAVYPW